jgi:hypothetical protein
VLSLQALSEAVLGRFVGRASSSDELPDLSRLLVRLLGVGAMANEASPPPTPCSRCEAPINVSSSGLMNICGLSPLLSLSDVAGEAVVSVVVVAAGLGTYVERPGMPIGALGSGIGALSEFRLEADALYRSSMPRIVMSSSGWAGSDSLRPGFLVVEAVVERSFGGMLEYSGTENGCKETKR